jgi:hypothetical protein
MPRGLPSERGPTRFQLASNSLRQGKHEAMVLRRRRGYVARYLGIFFRQGLDLASTRYPDKRRPFSPRSTAVCNPFQCRPVLDKPQNPRPKLHTWGFQSILRLSPCFSVPSFPSCLGCQPLVCSVSATHSEIGDHGPLSTSTFVGAALESQISAAGRSRPGFVILQDPDWVQSRKRRPIATHRTIP